MDLPLNQILRGDCVKVLDSLPAACADLVFADPPYNLQLQQDLYRPNHTKVDAVTEGWDRFGSFAEYDDFTRRWLNAARRVMKDDATIWVIGSYHNIFRVGAVMQDLGFWILNDVIWLKANPMPNFRGVRFTNAHETLIWAQKKKGAKYTFNHHALKSLNDDLQMRSDWVLPLATGRERIRKNGAKVHPTQKPESLLYRVLLASSSPGGLVLDPFFGSGTTGAVAKKLGRNFIGIEKDAAYIRSAKKRIGAVVPAPAGALTLEEIRRERRVPFGALLEAGSLQAGQTLYFADRPSIKAVIQADGRLKCKGQAGSIHAIAKWLADAPVNGWDAWLYAEANGTRKKIDCLREALRANLKETQEEA